MDSNPTQVLEATEGFVCDLEGFHYVINRSMTRIAADHPLAKAFPDRFQPVKDHLSYEVEAMTADPGEKRRRAVSTR